MKQTILFSILLFLCNSVVCQTIFSFDTLDIKQARIIENEIKSKEYTAGYKITISSDYFPGATVYKLQQPLCFIRQDDDFINDLNVEYFYTQSDSIVRLIVYNWDSRKHAKKLRKEITPKNLAKHSIDKYNRKYDILFDYFSSLFGQPTHGTGELEVIKKEDYGSSNQRRAKWETEKCKIELNMIWTDQNTNTDQGYKLVPTFRIRTKIYWI